MKARMALLGAGLLLAAGVVVGQQGPPEDPLAGLVFPPELVMRHQQAIELQPEQKAYIREEVLTVQTQFTELQWQLEDAGESMRALLEQPRVDEEQVLAQLERVLDTERQIKRLQIALLVRIKNKLTPEQQARLRELRSREPPPF
ncbi:MAG: Spy/CpxP family protein refolding chaperone [Terriglobia bacterium]